MDSNSWTELTLFPQAHPPGREAQLVNHRPLPRVLEPGSPVGREPGGVQGDGNVGQLEPDGLKVAEGLAEHSLVPSVLQGSLERFPTHGHGGRCERSPGSPGPALAVSPFSVQVGTGDRAVIEARLASRIDRHRSKLYHPPSSRRIAER